MEKALIFTQVAESKMYGYGVYLEIFFIAAELLDCMNECLNVDTGNCQLFAFQNGNCYLGRADVTNGAIAERLANVIVYSVTCKFQQQGLTMLWKCVYCNRSMINLRFFILSALLAYKNKSYLYNFGEVNRGPKEIYLKTNCQIFTSWQKCLFFLSSVEFRIWLVCPYTISLDILKVNFG